MSYSSIRLGLAMALLTPLLVLAGGCGQADNKTGRADSPAKGEVQVAQAKADAHSGWWCDEHGIPEAECSMCSSKVAAAFKKKGDWCEKHDRALSQCFICKPERQEFYAAKHRAKYGKEPPPIDDETLKKDEKDVKN